MSLNPSSSCFVPSKKLTTTISEGSHQDMARDTSTDSKDKYHAGSTKWGKYKKKEKEAKKRRGPTSHNNGPEKQMTE